MFNWIWENRPHASEISGLPLLPPGHWQFNWQFAHVLAKGPYPKFKFNPENIMLMLPFEHEKQESFQTFQDRKQELKEKYYQL